MKNLLLLSCLLIFLPFFLMWCKESFSHQFPTHFLSPWVFLSVESLRDVCLCRRITSSPMMNERKSRAMSFLTLKKSKGTKSKSLW
jgi:hypothetical protein